MCGIIGYTGYSDARGVLIKGLKTLEYRGYDSAGIALYNKNKNAADVIKCKGRVALLDEKTKGATGTCGIGHTRWATHGSVSDENSHPHKFGGVTLVHNGIIENYNSIKNQLGVESMLKSDTDSEIVAALIDTYYQKEKSPEKAIIKAVKDITGTFALGIMFDGIEDTIYAVRNVSPIVCCQNENGAYIASDIMAIGEYSDDYFVLPELVVAKIDKNGFFITDFHGKEIKPRMLKLDWNIKNNGKAGFPFYMEKEICEQPSVIEKTIKSRTSGDMPDFSGEKIDESIFEKCENITVIACGTAMHAGLIGKHLIEKYCKIPVNVNMPSSSDIDKMVSPGLSTAK